MLHRAPNGDLVTLQTTGIIFPAPSIVQQLWDNATQRRSPPAWDGTPPEAELVVWWAEPEIVIRCGMCHRPIGRFRSYKADDELGVVCVDTRRGRVTANRSMRTADPRYRLEGKAGMRARGTFARFRCLPCDHLYNRRLDTLGERLWRDRPITHTLSP
jgi:hypothetical protein